jgi:flagellar hook-associated protein 3 FlgL
MAQGYLLRRQNVKLSSEMSRLAQELASGQTADLSRHLNGNYSYLGDIERNLRVLGGFDTAAKEARLFTGAMQSSLELVQTTTSELSAILISARNTALPEAMSAMSTKAAGEFDTLVSALNTTIAGRTLFGGARTDATALASSDDIMSAVKAAVAGEVTMAGILAAVDNWFDAPGGGFATIGYMGDTNGLAPFHLGEGEAIDLDLRADDAAIRALLKHTSIAAIAADPSQGYPPDLQAELLSTAGENLISAQSKLTQIRADLGYAEERIDETATRIAAERTSLEYAKGELLAADPYETATRLESVQFQLESLYTATVRLSQLSLVGYMR